MAVSGISWESLMITWTAVRGADMYEVQAVDPLNQAVLCNDTSPVCVLSDLICNTRYNVFASPCNEARGCNRSCSPKIQETGKMQTRTLHYSMLCTRLYNLALLHSLTAPCMPERVAVSARNASSINITWTSTNKAANYTVNVIGSAEGLFTCQSTATSCQVNGLSCGSSYLVTSIASTAAGMSVPSYSVSYQTGSHF